MATDSNNQSPPWTLAGFNLGMRLALPVLPGMIAFGLAVGATAARKGFSFVDSLVMNVVVYAGMSQLVAMEAWPERVTLGAMAALAVLMITVNARMLLMSAALYPWLQASPPWRIYPTLHVLADPSWFIAMRYRAEGGSDAGILLGSSVLLAVAWIAATCVGHVGGTLIVDPRRYGIDLVMPIFFAAMLIPLWRGSRRAVAWIIAGVVAVAVHQLVGGWWFIVAGAVAGSVVGGFIDDDD
ncbi:MAG TPA: AzlC family ABC transporter permease [Xanthobacteraceae bacterium]|nr:AzlC family ABC transporter permease [Xanthobacteraceae bacterium]